jgi:hypothetical protein
MTSPEIQRIRSKIASNSPKQGTPQTRYLVPSPGRTFPWPRTFPGTAPNKVPKQGTWYLPLAGESEALPAEGEDDREPQAQRHSRRSGSDGRPLSPSR